MTNAVVSESSVRVYSFRSTLPHLKPSGNWEEPEREETRESKSNRNERSLDGSVFSSKSSTKRESSDPLPPCPQRHPQLGRPSPPLLSRRNSSFLNLPRSHLFTLFFFFFQLIESLILHLFIYIYRPLTFARNSKPTSMWFVFLISHVLFLLIFYK